MTSRVPGTHLRGRQSECAELDRRLAAVRAGHSAVVVLRGEAGIGKTALLEHVSDHADGCRVVRAAGVESEMELAFGGLHQLCVPFLDHLDRLPDPQRAAIGTAFGMSEGTPPDRFLVGLAVLSLIADVAQHKPLICLVDDAQWLDHVSAQILGFVARRLMADQVGLVFAVREPDGEHLLQGLPELVVEGLGEPDARALLDSAIHGGFDERIRGRILAEARGNPLALLELPRASSVAELAGGFASPGPKPVASRLQRSFTERVEALPPATRRLLLLAAAEPVGDVPLLGRAAERLGVSTDELTPAVAAGLLELDIRVRFRHPLVRSAVYYAAALPDRREAHRALAEATDAPSDPDRRAWHLARAAEGPDETVADELERSAGRAQSRGGAAAAAAFLAHAAMLTPQPRHRAARALAAAQAKLRAGALDAARELLVLAEEGVRDELSRARIDLLRAQIAFTTGRGNDASPLLLAAARRLAPLDAGLARETLLDAISAAMFAGRLAGAADARTVATAAREIAPVTEPSCNADRLLGALTVRFTEGYGAAAARSRKALDALHWGTGPEEVLRWSWLAYALAADLWDDRRFEEFTTRHVDTARAVGALGDLPIALASRATMHLFAGELDAASLLVAETADVQEATGGNLMSYGAVQLAAWKGDERAADALIQANIDDAVARGEGSGMTVALGTRAVLCNGLGKYDEAFAAAREAATNAPDLAVGNWALVEWVEAGARSGERAAAQTAAELLTEVTDAAGTDWALGVQARSRALLSEGDAAEALHREAVERLGRTRVRAELARAHLLFGEWLRRENRRTDAREQLRIAYGMFSGFGADGFAERARRELQGTGESVLRRAVAAPVTLTAQEAQIAHLARDGMTNPEIGAHLFISPHTVEWHLRKVFVKLGITSRRQLRSTLTDRPPTAAPA
ncbi:AAA family ATPase [Streptomyces sp. NPDC008086]|uniref:helix-turn-helix transcriptional regulator n=1 Tax=Streptomyces sp. NPDC008086 TaxID=3364807 RepID=UPI0036E82B20